MHGHLRGSVQRPEFDSLYISSAGEACVKWLAIQRRIHLEILRRQMTDLSRKVSSSLGPVDLTSWLRTVDARFFIS